MTRQTPLMKSPRSECGCPMAVNSALVCTTVCTGVDSGEENSSAAPAAIRSRDLSITSPALYQQAIPVPS